MAVEIKVNWSDLGDALKTKFMTDKSKKLIRAAWSGDLKNYQEAMLGYSWPNTRDYTMVLITLSPLALA